MGIKKVGAIFLSVVLLFSTDVIGINALGQIGSNQEISKSNSKEQDVYAVISNESTDASDTLTEYTGTFSKNNSKYSLNKNLDLGSYKIDANIHFNVKKYKNKSLLNKNKKSILHKYNVGDSKDFYVYNYTNEQTESINATLFYSGSKANVWVNDNQITESEAIQIGEEFDKHIYTKITSDFGEESDVDNDGMINILCYDIKDGYTEGGSYTGGYFDPIDLYDIEGSNKCEIFYVDTYPSMYMSKETRKLSTKKDISMCYTTLAHEFQHMINFNQNVVKENNYDYDKDMDIWINEGMSMAAEQIYSGSVLDDGIKYYNNSSSIKNGHSLLYWDYNGDELSNYSLSYLFLQYFKIQAGQGDKIFKELQQLKNNDYRDIETLIQKYIDPNMTFGQFMTKFRVALVLKEPTGLYGFKGEKGFDKIKTPIYTSGGTNLKGGGAVVKKIDTSSFKIPTNKGANITYTIVKKDTEKPVISGVNDKTIKVGDSFDSKEGVSAKDKEDGDITNKIEISGSVDTTKEGVYTLTYKVTDSDNNTTTATRKITVRSNEKPVISGANDKTIKVGDNFKTREGVRATDKEDGDITNKIKIDGSLDTTKSGKYTITYKVTDSDNNTTTATRKITVKKSLKTFSKFTVNKVTTKSTYVSGYGQKGATVKAYIKGKQIGKSVKISSKTGYYKIYIPKQKIGTKITLKMTKTGYITKQISTTVK